MRRRPDLVRDGLEARGPERRTSQLRAADRARLRRAAARPVDPQRSLFGPESVTWRVNREAFLLLGGGRALLLQIAHPLVAAGVAEHSRFEHAPLARLRRTLELTLAVTFGSAAATDIAGPARTRAPCAC